MIKNKKKLLIIFILLFCLILNASIVRSEEEKKENKTEISSLKDLSRQFVSISQRVRPAVVNITTSRQITSRMPFYFGPGTDPFDENDPFRDFFGDNFFKFYSPRNQRGQEQKRVQKSMGSGVIVDERGYILTNNHVVADASDITVKLFNQEEYPAKIVGTDPKTDIAVVKIEAKNLTRAIVGDSDQIQVGDWVLAIGNPFGLDQTVTAGIISAKGRSRMGIADYEDFIQTDAAINPGNSGGPLINLDSEVIGINTAIFSQSGGYQGVGFAVPINMAKSIMDSLIKKGKVTRGYLGINIQDLTNDLAKSFGLSEKDGSLISTIVKGSPAEKGGLKTGDIIIKYNGKKIKDTTQLRNLVAETEVGKEIEVVVIRDKNEKKFKIKIGEFKEEKENSLEDFGLNVQELTPELAQKFGYEQDEGILVANVQSESPADQAGIKRGDLILEVNNKKVIKLEHFKKALQLSEDKNTVLLLVRTGDIARYLVLKK